MAEALKLAYPSSNPLILESVKFHNTSFADLHI